MALGWGLWEGPARFIFWDPVFQESTLSSANLQRITLDRWTFQRSGIIYGATIELNLLVLE